MRSKQDINLSKGSERNERKSQFSQINCEEHLIYDNYEL